jgi:hypothetical protein
MYGRHLKDRSKAHGFEPTDPQILQAGQPIILAHGGLNPCSPSTALFELSRVLMLPTSGQTHRFFLLTQIEVAFALFRWTPISRWAFAADILFKALAVAVFILPTYKKFVISRAEIKQLNIDAQCSGIKTHVPKRFLTRA